MEPGVLGYSSLISISPYFEPLANGIIEVSNSISKDTNASISTSLIFQGSGPSTFDVILSDEHNEYFPKPGYNVHINISSTNNTNKSNSIELDICESHAGKQLRIYADNLDQSTKFIDNFLRFTTLPKTISSTTEEFFRIFENMQPNAYVIDSEQSSLDIDKLQELLNFKQFRTLFIIFTFRVSTVAEVETDSFLDNVITVAEHFASALNDLLQTSTVLLMADTYSTNTSTPLTITIVGA